MTETCEQCSGTAPLNDHGDYGLLCDLCSWRQAQHDEACDNFDHLSPSSFGFLSDDE